MSGSSAAGAAATTGSNERDIEFMSQEYFDDLRQVLERDCRLYDKTLECYQYAQFLEYRDKNIADAAPIYDRLCDERKHAASCLSSGMIALNTQGKIGGTGDGYGPAAFKRFEEACSRGDPKGCQNAGLLKKTGGHGVSQDMPVAIDYFDKACDGGERNGCYYMGLMHLTGTAQGTFVPDKTKALEYSSKACGMGHPWACANASRMCKIGDGVPVDMDQAAAFKEQYMRIKRGELS
eukprot:m.103821 g.103821  ORF g.103821 m.103821 type:complete len:236 (+) comp10497_c0_seq4:136-843(+)